MHGEGERKTKLRKRDRKSTHLLDLPVNPSLMGAYEDLLGPEGGGAAAEGLRSVLAKSKILGWGGHRRQLVRCLPSRNNLDGGKPSLIWTQKARCWPIYRTAMPLSAPGVGSGQRIKIPEPGGNFRIEK